MNHLSFLIKPSSGMCNMRCRYCFYDDVTNHRAEKAFDFMSVETAEALIRTAFSEIETGGDITFAFQGGEPTLIGLPFYQEFTALVAKYQKPGVSLHYAIQTNGLLLNEQWAAFLHEKDFLVGLSIDGPSKLHDSYRVDATGQGSWKAVTRALALLQKHSVAVNILCVVTRQCARSAQKVYHALKKLNVGYLQFIPCLDPLDAPRGQADYSLTPEAYGQFLCALFDAWFLDWKNGHYVSVRLFDDYVHLLLGEPSGSCAISDQCGSYLVVESNGDLYPCDFYVLDEWHLGNIHSMTPKQAMNSSLAQCFRTEGSIHPTECRSCKWKRVCCGGCKRDWVVCGSENKNYYCPSFQRLFDYAKSRLFQIVEAERKLMLQIRKRF